MSPLAGGRLNVLLVEDSSIDAELIGAELRRWGYDLVSERVDSAPSLTQAVTSAPWDIVLCDYRLPGFASHEAQEIVHTVRPDLPFVILSGAIGEEAAVEALRSGVKDVVLKTNLSRLGAVVQRVLAEAELRRAHVLSEVELRSSEARKSAILDSALDCIITIDHEGNVVDFNPAAEATFGYRRSDVAGRPMSGLIPPEQRAEYLGRFKRYLALDDAAGGGVRVELTAMRADKSEFPVELSINRVTLDGRAFFTAYLRDLTDLQIREREQTSLEEQVYQSQRIEAIGSLAGGITHDFNNILSVVIGYSDLALSELSDADPVRDYLQQIQRAADQGSSLTQQLLAFGRRQVLEPKVLDLNVVIADLEPMLARTLGADIEFVTRFDPYVGRIAADPGQVAQVIMNLAVNARDAMPAGGTLVIETSSATHDLLPYVVVSVSDTGCGMDAETASHVLEPFFTTKDVGEGTGLGLSTVYGIVTQSQGVLTFDSALGIGTTFRVFFPRVEAAVDPIAPAHVVAPHARGSETVLVVEDDDAFSTLLAHALRKDGYTVLTAANADEAVAVSAQHEDDLHLLLTDIVMPGRGGLALAQELRERRPELQILFMSGYMAHIDSDVALRAPGSSFLQKPFTLATLAGRMRELLDARGAYA